MFVQTLAALAQFGSVLHVHDALPATPVQVWLGPHAVPASQAVHPLPCARHVSSPAPPQRVEPAVHAFVQQAALPAAP